MSLEEIKDVVRCPINFDSKPELVGEQLKFEGEEYPLVAGTPNFLKHKDFDNEITKRALANWGEGLHNQDDRNLPDSWHHQTFYDVLGENENLYPGDKVLEIGCGEGFDARIAAKKNPTKQYFAMDLGQNVYELAQRDQKIPNLHYIRGNALNLPFSDNTFDGIVSFGVFHHTADPVKCMQEALRVLKPNGSLYIYLYKDHEDNFYKKWGLLAEKLIMKLTHGIGPKKGRLICWLLSPFVLLAFSYPAKIVKFFSPKGSEKWQTFPLWWGTTPASVVNDLQDRLFASINYRYSLKQFEELFSKNGYKNVKVETYPGGHCGVGYKK